jgi:hypothetical protein
MARPLLPVVTLALLLAAALAANCGDGLCDRKGGECGSCVQDCQLLNADECIGDGNCTAALGEDCSNSRMDCECRPGEVCRPGRNGTSARGCIRPVCGDGSCEGPEDPLICCADCGCAAGEKCQNGACCPASATCCTSDGACGGADRQCVGRRCVARARTDLADGTTCAGPGECASGICANVTANASICCQRTSGCCRTTADCAAGLECSGSLCAEPAAPSSSGLSLGGWAPTLAVAAAALAALALALRMRGRLAGALGALGAKRAAPEPPKAEAGPPAEGPGAKPPAAAGKEPPSPAGAPAGAASREAVKAAILMGGFTCPRCGKSINTDWSVCPYCSADLASAPKSSGATSVYAMDGLDDAVRLALTSALSDLSLKPSSLGSLEAFDGDLLVVITPDAPPGREAVENILARVRAGAGLFLVGAGGADNSPLNRIAYKLGVRFNADLVCDYEGENVTYMPHVAPSAHTIASGLSKPRLVASCSLEVQDPSDVVLYAGATSFGDEDQDFAPGERERKGNLPIMAAHALGEGRVVMFGDANGLALDERDARILLRNALAWLLRREAPRP